MDHGLIKDLNDWYAGKRVFITGHTGFKGSWLSVWLSSAGARVTGYALAAESTGHSLYREANLDSCVDSIIGDICDRSALEAALHKAQPEIVFHLAAQSLVRASYAHPVETYRTNVLGTVELLDALRNHPAVKAVVIVTSDKCYENRGADRPHVEDDPLGGSDPYSSSKGCAEIATSAFRQAFFNETETSVASARAGNVIGPGDWAHDRLIPDIVRATESSSTVVIRNPHAVRPWQFVLEPLRGYLMLAHSLSVRGKQFASAWNFGPNDADTARVGELADLVAKAFGGVDIRHSTDATGPSESQTLRIDSTKASELLGWQPAIKLARAVELTVNGYKAFRDDGNVLTSMQQILSSYLKEVDAAQ